ncbi:MAG: GGDEF domain-containing protein [Candidatus Firestonebacteria bacterium]
MEKSELTHFRNNFINVRWLIVIATAYMGIFAISGFNFPGLNFMHGLVLFYILTNVALYFFSLELLNSNVFKYTIFLVDIALVSLSIYAAGSANSDLFLLYFLVIVITAIGQNVQSSIIATVIASLLYLGFILKGNIELTNTNLLLRVPFLFVVGIFTSFLAESVEKQKESISSLKLLLRLAEGINECVEIKDIVKAVEREFADIPGVEYWDIAVFNSGSKTVDLLRAEKRYQPVTQKVYQPVLQKMQRVNIRGSEYFPLFHSRKPLGYLIIKPVRKKGLSPEETQFYLTVTAELSLALDRMRLYEEVKRLANIDRLTGAHNYNYFIDFADRKVREAAKTKRPFALLMIDLDNFKMYNDSKGHIAGNLFLKKTADAIYRAVGQKNTFARYGGDEFTVLLEDYGKDLVGSIRKIKMLIEAELLKIEAKHKVTTSIGYAVFPQDGGTFEALLQKADSSLYRAKNTGKNKISYV